MSEDRKATLKSIKRHLKKTNSIIFKNKLKIGSRCLQDLSYHSSMLYLLYNVGF